jgi:Ca2+-binding RTX toxin-like protein
MCPSGGVPTQINVNSSNADVGIESVKRERVGARVRLTVEAPQGASTQIQAICRKAGAPLARDANLTYGSASADVIDRGRARSSVYAGMGNDVIVLSGAGSVGDGGLGADDITVSAKDAVGVGGFGRDVLRSTTSKRSLIIGGPGRDSLTGGPGRTIINAQDGRPGDVVTCTSSLNEVYKDKGDILSGPCTIIR